jgi:hypothetical protein
MPKQLEILVGMRVTYDPGIEDIEVHTVSYPMTIEYDRCGRTETAKIANAQELALWAERRYYSWQIRTLEVLRD